MATQEESQLIRTASYNSGSIAGGKYKVLVGLTPRSQPFDESMDSLDNAMAYALKWGIEVGIEKVRGGVPGWQNWGPIFCTMMKDSSFTHIFAAADDMLYPDDILPRLVSRNKDIICGIYRKSIAATIEPANWVANRDSFMDKFRDGGVYETPLASGHTMLLQRHVIEKMIADYPELAYESITGETHYALAFPMIQDGKVLHDDWALSMRARNSGFTIWDDYSCRCRHYCGHFIGFEELENALIQEHIAEQESLVAVE